MLQIENELDKGSERTVEEQTYHRQTQQAVIPNKSTLPSDEVLSIVREVLEEQVKSIIELGDE